MAFDGTVVCIASGPSLTKDDCDLVGESGLMTIAVNTSWKIARFAHHIYAGDARWWDAYGHEIDIDAQRWTCSRQAAAKHRINHHVRLGPYNSGLRAIQLAMDKGAATIILLGYDCCVDRGIHWHGLHDETPNPDAKKAFSWRKQFEQLADEAKRRRRTIINCSRNTALSCFDRANLEDVLWPRLKA